MQKVKEAFLKEGALDVVVSIMVDPLTKLPRIRREEEDAIQLVLAFVRNLLCIPDCNATGGLSSKSSMSPHNCRNAAADTCFDAMQVAEANTGPG